MARRNIFDRDTRAGDYSDTLANFIENIPSIYGQLAKEKRLERLDREDRNFRTTQYNNQLLQQARNNRRQDEIDRLNQNQFQFKKEKENFDREFEVAKLAYESGNPNPLIQVNQRYGLGMDTSQTDNFISNVTNRKEFEEDLLDFNSLSPTEKFEKGADLKDLISRGRQLSMFGNSQDRYLMRNTVNNLQKQLDVLVKNSGQLITDTDMWEGLKGRTAATAYKKNDTRIKKLEDQINKLEISNNELTFGVNPSIDKQSTKKKLSNDTQISRIRNEVNKLLAKNIELQNNYRYPVFNIDAEEEDNTFADITPPETTVDKTNLIESDIINKIEEGDDEAINEILKVMDSDDTDAVPNYLAKLDPQKRFDMFQESLEDEEGESQPIQTNVADTEADGSVDEDLTNNQGVLNTVGAANVPNRFADNLAKEESQPKIDLNPQTEEVQEVQDSVSGEELFSTEPEKQVSQREEEGIKQQEDRFRERDKNFDAGLNVSKSIFDSNIRDVSGNRINITNSGDFFNQIKSMANRIKQINQMPAVKARGTRGVPRTFVQSQQLLSEQRQLYRDLFELKNRLKNVKTIYFPEVDSQGNKTGRLTKRDTSSYNKSLDRIINKLPKDFDLAFKKDRLSQSEYEQIVS